MGISCSGKMTFFPFWPIGIKQWLICWDFGGEFRNYFRICKSLWCVANDSIKNELIPPKKEDKIEKCFGQIGLIREPLPLKRPHFFWKRVCNYLFFYESGRLKAPGRPGLNRVGIHSCLNSFEIYTLLEENHRFIYTITFCCAQVLMARGFANCVLYCTKATTWPCWPFLGGGGGGGHVVAWSCLAFFQED